MEDQGGERVDHRTAQKSDIDKKSKIYGMKMIIPAQWEEDRSTVYQSV